MDAPTSELVQAGDTKLYVEQSGRGPGIVLVPGAGGDAGQYAGLAAELSLNHLVVTYDRRGNSRSPRTDDWATTSVAQHADDVLALLEALDLTNVTLFGNSTGAVIALAAALSGHPSVVELITHEPTLFGVLADPDGAVASVQPVIAAGVEQGGLPGGAEAFLRFAAGEGFERLPAEAIERIRGNAQTMLEAEFGAFASWQPDASELRDLDIPVLVLSAEQTAPFFVEAADWLAAQLGTETVKVPGGHMGFLDDPADFAHRMGMRARKAHA
jgi:pimeloyl-ACP methyl ester carboxylesterase